MSSRAQNALRVMLWGLTVSAGYAAHDVCQLTESRMDSQVKVDFMNYLLSNSGEAVKTLRKLIYDFLSAKEAIESAAKYDDISMWVSTVVEQLKPSIKRYSSQQINLAFILLLYEQTIRDDSYNDVLCRYMEEYQTEGSVY